MRVVSAVTMAGTIAVLGTAFLAAAPQDANRSVAGGGVHVQGWTGQIDASAAGSGSKLEDAKFVQEGANFHITTGPAVSYWNPANTASGDYTVKATFTEPKFMDLNNHPHPYGLFIAGSKMGTPDQSLLYCAAYGNGNFIVRGFGPEPFQMNGRRGGANPAVHQAGGPGQPVTQEIAFSVKGDRAECSINGTVVAGYDKAELVGPGKLDSLDGVYGLRLAHNVEVVVSGFGMTK